MATTKSAAKPKPPPRRSRANLLQKLYDNPKVPFAVALLLADSLLVALIIAYVPYTKIDWDAYMSQVSGFLEGERDYANLKGDTGPLVYPAGFLYVYSAIQFVTGGNVFPAQILFGFLYILNLGIMLLIYVKTDKILFGFLYIMILGIMLFIYVKTDKLPWWALTLLCLSKRVHSIFVLRLFNDCFAMTLLHASLASLLYQKWHLSLIIFSLAVSVKMNVLLYAPPLFLLMLKAMDIVGVISALAGAALVQILLGLPFLLSYPIAYLSRAFNLGRVFIHFWSVNFKFVPEPVFVSKEFAIFLLVAHLFLLTVFAHHKWCKHEGGLVSFLQSRYALLWLKINSIFLKKDSSVISAPKLLKKEHIIATMFVGNFIGIVCARSLHYQFYSWYFCSIPYLLWMTPFPTALRLILFAGVEFCWNVFPSTSYSSILLLCFHALILWGLWIAPPEVPYEDEKSLAGKRTE